MADIQTNFAIAIVGMTIFCIILIGFPLAFMLTDSFREKKKKNRCSFLRGLEMNARQ